MGALSLKADVEVAEGLLKSEAIGMAGLASDPSIAAVGIGVDGVYTRDYSESIAFGVGLSAAMPVVESDDEGLYGGGALLGLERTNGGKSGLFFSLNRFYVDYTAEAFSLQAGRFLFDSPLVSSSVGYRMAPDATEAVIVSFDKEALSLKGGYLNAFSGPISGSTGAGGTEKGSFVAMSDAGFGDLNGSGGNVGIEDMGLLVGGAEYQVEALTAQGWLYLMPSIKSGSGRGGMQTLYGDGHYEMALGAHIATLSGQLLHMAFSDDLDGLTHTAIGAKMHMQVNADLGVEAALSSVSGDGALLEPWGPTPAFASGYEASIASLHEGFALRIGGEYALGDLGQKLRQSRLLANMIYQSGDATAWGADTDAIQLEGVFSAKLGAAITGDARLLVAGGDAEGAALLARAAYPF
jgi:hypothetical protein